MWVQDNSALRQLKLGNNALSTMFGASSIKNIFKQRNNAVGLVATLS